MQRCLFLDFGNQAVLNWFKTTIEGISCSVPGQPKFVFAVRVAIVHCNCLLVRGSAGVHHKLRDAILHQLFIRHWRCDRLRRAFCQRDVRELCWARACFLDGGCHELAKRHDSRVLDARSPRHRIIIF